MVDPLVIRVTVFYALMFSSCGYAIWRGGAPERIAASLLVAATFMTLAVGYPTRFHHIEAGVFLVDLTLLAGLVAVAIKADRFWPIVLAALHLDGTATHILKLFDTEVIRATYAVMIAMWSYPMFVILAVGTLRHQRRLAQFGEDRSWSLALSHFSRETADVDQRESDAQTKAGSWGAFRRHRRIGGDQA